jgi:fructose-bisphosphate aldolase class II
LVGIKVDSQVGIKNVYGPGGHLEKAEASMTKRVIEACNDLHCAGKSVSAG